MKYSALATDPSTLELDSKLDTSNFQEPSGINTGYKSFGIEISVVETENGKPPMTGMYINYSKRWTCCGYVVTSSVKTLLYNT